MAKTTTASSTRNNTTKSRSVSLSKTAKISAAQFTDPHRRGQHIRFMLDAENAAHRAKFARVKTKEAPTAEVTE
jgi:hypothetical protein